MPAHPPALATRTASLRSAFPAFAWEPGLPCTDPDNDPDLWHSRGEDRITLAQKLCRACPRLDDCAAWAIATRQEHGVWGATTARDRARKASA